MRSTTKFLIFVLGFITAENAGAQIVDSLKEESSNEPPKGMEIFSKRTSNSKTYLNADNTVTVEISSGYWHYQDRHGQFHEIDRRLVLAPDSTGYQVTKGLYAANFGFDLQKDAYPITFEMSDRTRFRAKLTSLAYYNRASKQIVTLQNVRDITGAVNGNKIRYPEAFEGVDVEFEYLDTKLKQYAYLSHKARDNLPDPQSLGLDPNNTDLVLVIQIDVPDSLEAFANNTKISSKSQGEIRLAYEGEEKIEFRNTGGKLKFLLPSDFAFTALNVNADSTSRAASSQRMWRRFFSSGNDNLMLTGVPVQWLFNQPAGMVVLDPSIAMQPGAEGRDTFIYAGNGGDDNHGALTQLQIGPDQTIYERRGLIYFDLTAVPQNATITSATFQLYLFGHTGDPGTSFTIEAYKMLRSWVEGTGAGWNGGNNSGCDWRFADLPNDVRWSADGMQAGTDYSTTVLGTAPINISEDEIWKSWPIALSAVQEWVTNPSSNFGLALVTAVGDISKYIVSQFYSSDNSSFPTLRPKLLVTYTVNPLITIAYDDLSRPDTVYYANGVKEINQYDANRGWMTRRDYQKSGTNIYYFNSTGASDFDQAGNLKKVEYKYSTYAAETMEYGYDALHRINQFKQNGVVKQDYDYDPNGNRKSIGNVIINYGSNNNRLTHYEDPSIPLTRDYTFDLAGRVQTINGTTTTHDIRNNMTAHGSNTYAYDSFGQRLRKTESGTIKYYVTSGPQILAEYKSSNELEAEYIYALGRMVAKLDSAKGYLWFYVDHLGSTRLVDDQDSQTDMRRDYYPYGEAYLAVGDQTAYQFTQKELDSGIGLYYFGARYYDSSIGRWLVPDPAGQGWSPYAYGGNRPLVMVDADGRFFMPFLIGAAIGGLWAGASYSIMAGESWTSKGFGRAFGLGALGGALSGGIGSLGTSGWTNVAYGILGQSASWAATTAVSGGDLTGPGFAGVLAAGIVGGLMPGYTAQRGAWFANGVAEVMYGAGKGAVTSSVAALVSTRNLGSLNSAIRQGARYGAVNSFVTVVMLGPAVQPNGIEGLKKAEEHFSELGYGIGRFKPVYREGGLFGLIHRMGADGITIGRNLLVYDDDPGTYIHETMHYYQQFMQGWGAFYGRAAYEQWIMKWFIGNPYTTEGTNEWFADDWAKYYGRF